MRYLLILLLLGVGTMYGQEQRLSIIPEPASIQRMKGDFKLTPQVIVHYNDDQAKVAAGLLNDFIFSTCGFRLQLRQSDRESHPAAITISHNGQLAAEAYSLAIHANAIQLSGNQAGLFYGVQTLQQLFPGKIVKPVLLPAVQINDQPRFAYRGLMLDVSRHFFSVDYIKKFLDVMSHFKLNHFHWHLTDDQGWRIEIKKYPELQNFAAWRTPGDLEQHSPHIHDGRYGGYYTQSAIREIVAYAADRHITIIPEIEMPGHSGAALAAFPALGCTQGPYTVKTIGTINKDVYCPGNEAVFTFLEGVIEEVITLFPGKYIHIGGDETPKDRWAACVKCKSRMTTEGLPDEHHLQSYFVQRMEKYINSKGRSIIGWDEILEGGLAPNATVMSWRGEKGGIEAARQQHDVIMSPYTYVYFDYYQGNPSLEPPAIGGFLPLQAVYKYEPLSDSLTSAQQHYIKGVQANTWTEFIANDNHADYMVYPRALAIAEIGWSPATKKNYPYFLQKLQTRLAALDQRHISFRIPEPDGLKDSTTIADQIIVKLRPAVKGATLYYTMDGAIPTIKSQQYLAPFKRSLIRNIPVTIKTITVLPSGRKSRVHTATYFRKPASAVTIPPVIKKNHSPKTKTEKYTYLPVIVGDWWNITSNPDLGAYTSSKQEPVDFGIWQAGDGSWQLWSCIRSTKAGGHTRLFYRWETKNIQDTNWSPKGIAMQADTSLGEEKGGLQAPFVLKEKDHWYMFYGNWNQICLAKSSDGKNFKRVLNQHHTASLFSGPMNNSRDPMVLKIGGTFYCYYTTHLEKDDPAMPVKSAIFCRTSTNLTTWSDPVLVSSGGKVTAQTSWYGGDAECPFVVKIDDQYVLFRNQNYGKHNMNTQYASTDPLDFGAGNDQYLTGQLPVAAPEIIRIGNQFYIVALKPGLDGMRMARLDFIKKPL